MKEQHTEQMENRQDFGGRLAALRRAAGLSQQQLADQLFVTRQAVSRWERGETTPNVDTLKQISRLMDVSLNTLLGCPRELYCQSCGMPLEDEFLGRDSDCALNEKFCKWCYDEGHFLSDCTMEEMQEQCVSIMVQQGVEESAARQHMVSVLPQLERWKQ